MEKKDYYALSESALKELADNGDVQACFTLGLKYYYSIYGERKILTPYTYLLKAYNGGNKKAAPFLGEIFYFKQIKITGYTSDEEYFKMAYRLFKEAKEMNLMAGWRGLAKMLIKGDYLKQDLSQAYFCLTHIDRKDEECAYLLALMNRKIITPDHIIPNTDFVKFKPQVPEQQEVKTVQNQAEQEPEEQYEEYWWNEPDYENDEAEMLVHWLSCYDPKDDGFNLPLTLEDIAGDLDMDIEIEVDDSSWRWYDWFNGTTVSELLKDVIESNDEAIEMLIELSRIYRTMDGWELPKAAYWAHKAVILARKCLRIGSLEYIEGSELLCEALGALGDAYFSYPCTEDETQWFPNLNLALKYYASAEKEDHQAQYDYEIMAGRAQLALGFQISQIELTMHEKLMWDGEAQAWFGQMNFVKGYLKNAIEWWDKAIEGSSGWGEYFKGRYLWGRKQYSEAINLWKQGEKKGCNECTAELFNWIVGQPQTTYAMKKEQAEKSLRLYYGNSSASICQYLYKHITNGNITFEDERQDDGSVWNPGKGLARGAIYSGIRKHFCPYCAKIYKEKFGAANASLAMKAWGYDNNMY